MSLKLRGSSPMLGEVLESGPGPVSGDPNSVGSSSGSTTSVVESGVWDAGGGVEHPDDTPDVEAGDPYSDRLVDAVL